MLEADLHAHSLFSPCGLHSIIEMLEASKKKGLKAQAITDHGPFLGRKISSTFFERLQNPVEGITFLKGMECNVLNEDGEIDIITRFMKWYDIVLLGFHNYKSSQTNPEYYSKTMVKAIKKNPCVDIIVHPNTKEYLMNFSILAKAAAETDTAIEFNNTKSKLGRTTEELTIELIKACKKEGCNVAVNTDAHAINEVGDHSRIEELLKKTNFPQEKIVNRTLESTLKWIESRKKRRAEFY